MNKLTFVVALCSLALAQVAGAALTVSEKQAPHEGALAEEVTKITWTDQRGMERETHLVTKGEQGHPGWLSYYRYDEPALECLAMPHSGGGMSDVSHFPEGANRTIRPKRNKFRGLEWVFKGENHAIVRVKYSMDYWDKERSYKQRIEITRDLFFAAGCDYFLYALSMDFSAFEPGVVVTDTRSPYLEWNWKGVDFLKYTGFAAGTERVLECRDMRVKAPKLIKGTAVNNIPFAHEWDEPTDRACAIIATRTYSELPQGLDYWPGSSEPIIPEGSYPLRGEGKKECWELPYQLGCYAETEGRWQCKLTWQAPFGLGAKEVSFGKHSFSGYPKYSYATLVTLDRHSSGRIGALIKEQEVMATARIRAAKGEVLSSVSPGPGREDESVVLAVPGYDPMLRAFRFKAVAGEVKATLELVGKLVNPTLVIDGWQKASVKLTLSGKPLEENDFCASYDSERQRLYLTLKQVLDGAAVVRLQ